MENLRNAFLQPAAEFGPIPFWFWNDDLDHNEIRRQIHAFLEKGIPGFVIHPRKGLTEAYRYLSEPFMDAVAFAVEEAEKLGMFVFLYDEAMYPSGSAGGLVVKENPRLASKGLKMTVLEEGQELPTFGEGNWFVSALCRWEDGCRSFDSLEEAVAFRATQSCTLTYFSMVYTKGHIRGVHPGEDDEEPNAPASADLLDPEAVKSFIRITYDAYYSRLSRHFGKTIQAIFTDEPSIMGRGPLPGLIAWSHGILEEYIACGGSRDEMDRLFEKETNEAKKAYDRAISRCMGGKYFAQLSGWCEEHNIALTGHPHSSQDIGHLAYFQLPFQDMVWRFVDPLKENGLEGVHSTMGKCSADSAKHRGRRRNGNEVFGACGRADDPWNLPSEDVKWYLDWLFVRGVNMMVPHAFFFSLRGDRGDERPPDVGMNSIWWQDYHIMCNYIKRLCCLNTDSNNLTDVAVLATSAMLPWQPVQSLYRSQIEFNYLEADLLKESDIGDGAVKLQKQSYRLILVDENLPLTAEHLQLLEECRKAGVAVRSFGEITLEEIKNGYDAFGIRTNYPVPDLRVTHVEKDGVLCYLLVNEGNSDLHFHITLPVTGKMELWDPWRGTVKPVAPGKVQPISLGFRECVVLAVEKAEEAAVSLTFTQQADAKTLCYEGKFTLAEDKTLIQADAAHNGELAHLWLDGKDMGIQMWKPYTFSCNEPLAAGEHTVRVHITAGLSSQPTQAPTQVNLQLI